MRVGGLRFCVMLCGRGLRTSHMHRPITTYLDAKIQLFSLQQLFFLSKIVSKLHFLKNIPIFAVA